jgi:pilus assembly protein Flp/PilA
MTKLIKNFLNDEAGASAAEYALLLAIIGIGIVVAAGALGTAISKSLNDAATAVNTRPAP